MRKVNEMFHIEDERLVKTSNGQPVPEDEPIFILRGRDKLAVAALRAYWYLCEAAGTPEDRLESVEDVITEFYDFTTANPTKTPGSTHGR